MERKVKRARLLPSFCWDELTVPNEITEFILFNATGDNHNQKVKYKVAKSRMVTRQQFKLSLKEKEEVITAVVCRRVCKLWRDILPPPYAMYQGASSVEGYWGVWLSQRCHFAVVAARLGRVTLLEWAKGEGCDVSKNLQPIVEAAVRGGHQTVLDWLKEAGYSFLDESLSLGGRMAKRGHLGILKWLQEEQAAGGMNLDFGSIRDYAAKYGHLDVVQWAAPLDKLNRFDKATKNAAARGHIEIAKWLQDNPGVQGPSIPQSYLQAAAKHNQIDFIIWLKDTIIPPTRFQSWTFHIRKAARKGHMEALRLFREWNPNPWHQSYYTWAAASGKLEVLDWLEQIGCQLAGNEFAWKKAISHGHLEVLKWLHGRGCFVGLNACTVAWEKDQMEIFEWLMDHGFTFDIQIRPQRTEIFRQDGIGKKLEMMAVALKPSDPWQDGAVPHQWNYNYVISSACSDSMTLALISWLHSNGCPYSEQESEFYVFAANSKKWETMKYLHNAMKLEFQPSGARLCSILAEGGEFEMLKWARQGGAIWDRNTTVSAMRKGRLDILIWARENGCPMPPDPCRRARGLKMLKWLVAQGYQMSSHVCAFAAFKGKLKMLQWAREMGCPWDSRVIDMATTHKHPLVLDWAIANGCPLSTPKEEEEEQTKQT